MNSNFFFTTCLLIVNWQVVCVGQSDSIFLSAPSATWEKNLLQGHTKNQGTMLSLLHPPTTKVMKWKWQCLGPNIQPEELNPGGKAIPAYSVGRGNGTGRINYIYLHPTKQNRLWACSPTGGLWYTKNGGTKWLEGGTDKLPISGVSSVAVNLKKSHQWVVSVGDGDDQFMYSNGLWRTTNAGKNYVCINGDDPATALPFGPNDSIGYISEVVCSPSDFDLLFTATSRGFWMCADAGRKSLKKWKRVAEGNFFNIEYIDRNDPELDVIIATGEKMLISFDGSKTWEEIALPHTEKPDLFQFKRITTEYSAALPNFVYVAIAISELWKSSPSGEATLYLFDLKTKEWKFVRSMQDNLCNLIHTRARAFGVSPTDPNLVMFGNVQPWFRSTDGGLTFKKIEKNQMHDDCHHIEFANDGKTVWASHDGGVSVSYDAGLTFQSKDLGIGAANVFGVSTAQTTEAQVLYGGYDVGANLLRHGKWRHVSWGDGFETITHPINSNIMFSTMQNGSIHRSTTGDNFDDRKNANGYTSWHTWIRMHPTLHHTIYCSGELLKRSSDLGNTWETIFNAHQRDTGLYAGYRFFLAEKYPNVMYVYCISTGTMTNPQIWRTSNLLEADAEKIIWEKVNAPCEGWITNIEIDPSNKENFYVSYSNIENDCKISYYNGAQYANITSNIGDAKCESMILQRGEEQRLYVGTNHGVFTKTKNETEWNKLSGLPGTFIKTMAINYEANKLIVGTFGRGIWQGDLVLGKK